MAESIFPSENDIGGLGVGRIGSEENLSGIFGAGQRRNFIARGLVAGIKTGLLVDVTLGAAIISGYYWVSDASEDVTVNASETDAQWYIQLTRDGTTNDVNGWQWVRFVAPKDDGSDDPVDSVRVFRTTTNATVITTLRLTRNLFFDNFYGEYTGDDGSGQFRSTGATPTLAIVIGDGQAGADIYGISSVNNQAGIGISARSATLILTSSDAQRPQLEGDGILVSAGSGDTLNENGKKYRMMAVT